jgi:uncharacterized protein
MKIVLLLALLNTLQGTWLGTIRLGNAVMPVRFEVVKKGPALSATLTLPFEGISDAPVTIVSSQNSGFEFEFKQGDKSFLFAGDIQKNVLQGNVSLGAEKGSFELVRSVSVDVQKYFGTYGFDSGKFLHVRTWDELGENQLTYLDEKGRVGPLYATSETDFFTGPGVWIPLPVVARIAFEKDAKGEITGLIWSEGEDSQKATKRSVSHREEEVAFKSGQIKLSGSLVLPPGKGPFPAVVLVHGSGPATRDFFGPVSYLFARRGIAVLSYDKRGIGKSEGHWLDASFADYASDALAGAQYLTTRKEIQGNAIGLWGVSQAGWIIPQAIERGKNIAFAVLLSAPAVTPFEQEIQRNKQEMEAVGTPKEQIEKNVSQLKADMESLRSEETKEYFRQQVEKLQKEGNQKVLDSSGSANPRFLAWYSTLLDYDPVPALQNVKCPVLVLYGELDRGVPLDPNKRILEDALKKAGNNQVTVRVFPNGNHALLLSETGSMSEFPRLTQFVPGLFDTMVDWIVQITRKENLTQRHRATEKKLF